jgi:hypothetical protein
MSRTDASLRVRERPGLSTVIVTHFVTQACRRCGIEVRDGVGG